MSLESRRQAPALPFGCTSGLVFDKASRFASRSKARYLLVVLMLAWPSQWAMVLRSLAARSKYRAVLCLLFRDRNSRHSWASHMLAAGADLAYVSSQLGHANPSITLRIYSHWVPGTRRVTTSVLDTASANVRQMLEKNEGTEGADATVNH